MSEIEELKARIAALEAEAAKPKFVPSTMERIDPTARMGMPPSAIAEMVGVVQVQDLVADGRRQSAPSSIIGAPFGAPSGSAPRVGREVPIGPRPRREVELVDRIVERFVGGPNDPVR
jgi:hypothetical protein